MQAIFYVKLILFTSVSFILLPECGVSIGNLYTSKRAVNQAHMVLCVNAVHFSCFLITALFVVFFFLFF